MNIQVCAKKCQLNQCVIIVILIYIQILFFAFSFDLFIQQYINSLGFI